MVPQGLPHELQVPVVKNPDDVDGDLAVQQANLRKQLEQDWLWTLFDIMMLYIYATIIMQNH